MNNKLWTENITFILVRPEFLGNIGSTCRVIKNFGFRNLRLVEAPRQYKSSEARMMAVGAFDILKEAKLFNSLEEALHDIDFAVATSSGRRRSRPLDNLNSMVDNVVSLCEKNKIAIVFGHEKSGLKDEELALCNRQVRIETAKDFSSMNVSQAACCIAYALNVSGNRNLEQPSQVKIVPELPSRKDANELFDQMSLLVDNIEFSKPFNKDKILQEIRDAYERMTPTKRECSLIKGVLFTLNKKLKVTNNGDKTN